MNSNYEIVFLISAGIVIVLVLLWIWRTEKRLKKFFTGKKAKDLEQNMLTLEENISDLTEARKAMESEISEINKKLRKSIRGLETIRFNPFSDQGGNQSFAIGMLNEDGDGVVLSSLYSRDRMSVFAKPIKEGKSDHELTIEEKEVLKKAKI